MPRKQINGLYKISKYTHSGPAGKYGVLVFNLLTSAIMVMKPDDHRRMESMDVTQDECLLLASNGFIVPIDEDEVEKVITLRNINNFNSTRAAFQILPTTSCNAKCPYCYEEHFKRCSFPKEDETLLAQFIGRYIQNLESIHITWFGGEPLLRPGFIERLSQSFLEQARYFNTDYSADIITNGSLITSKIARMLAENHVKNAQISIDGTHNEYKLRKHYLDPTIELQDVFDNINLLMSEGIRVSVRINLDKNNHADVLELIELLGTEFSEDELFAAHVAPLYASKDGSACYSSEELADAYKPILRALIDAGIIRTLDGLPLNFNNASCCAQGINNFCISPNGMISKCDHLLSDDMDVVGSIYEGIRFNSTAAFWANPNIPTQCMECGYLPSCQAGCYAAEHIGFGYGRCPYIKFIYEAIFDAASYLIGKSKTKKGVQYATH